MFARRCWRVLLIGLLLLSSVSVSASIARQEISATAQQPIRVSVERVNVGVLVSEPSGKFVEGLRREDFHVFDNAVEQPITDFLAVEEPAQALLLIESGPAVYLLEGGHLQAARAFLDGLARDDRVAVVRYDNAPQGLIDFTIDK